MVRGSDTDAINAARDAGLAAFNAGEVDRMIEVWVADDAVFMHPNEPPIVGKTAIRIGLQGLLAKYRVHQSLTSEELVIAGDWAFNRLTVRETITPKAGGEPVRTEGKGIDIYHRQTDGSWKVSRSITNSNVSSLTLVTEWGTGS
jgi:ketosteroid isomerase-like protein